MSVDIYSYPVSQRPRVAVSRFRRTQGEHIFNKLLNHLELNYEEFVQEYGEKLLGNPTCLNHTIVEMITEELRRNRSCSK